MSLGGAGRTWRRAEYKSSERQVVLAVMVAVSAHQAYGIPTYGTPAHSTHSYGYGQPRYVGPLASSVPAGVGGKIIPVSDTYEVAAAKNQFFRTYQDQVNTINAIRASRPTRYGTSYGSAGPVHVSHPAPAPAPAVVSTYSGPARVSHSISAPVHVFQSSYGAPAVSHSSYGTPSYAPFTAPTQVSDTPEVAAAKAEFFRLYNQQAAAAAAAPDDYTVQKYY
ncbi:Cuticle protein CP1876 [Portunus trituberculatus]|uniref:Cuticle protein CP1876 n=1 Tax=Portunus trituberculatus TaxID=210409 RepID=A0A5B7H8D8_PORTR|nr:Cuticle protein CP1876 [Portunus trituberculatus]